MFKLREQGSSRAGKEAQSPWEPACWGLGCIRKNMNKGRRELESDLPGGAYLYRCPGNCTWMSLVWSSALCHLAAGASSCSSVDL